MTGKNHSRTWCDSIMAACISCSAEDCLPASGEKTPLQHTQARMTGKNSRTLCDSIMAASTRLAALLLRTADCLLLPACLPACLPASGDKTPLQHTQDRMTGKNSRTWCDSIMAASPALLRTADCCLPACQWREDSSAAHTGRTGQG